MTRIFSFALFSIIGFLAACGSPVQDVTRGPAAPIGFLGFQPDHSGATSTRTSLDLLSLG